MSAEDEKASAKKICLDETNFSDLKKFEIVRVISSSELNCNIVVEAKLRDKEDKAVVILKKLPFSSEKIEEYFSSDSAFRTLFHNDVYFNQIGTIPIELNEIKVDIICPANDGHILKYEKNQVSFVHETPILYEEVTKKYIDNEAQKKTWIYNILDHEKEKDRIVCEDADQEVGFIMIPDFKWTGEQMDDLYLLALVVRRDIGSIRDLTAEHIPLLNNLYDKCVTTITAKYGLPEHKLRVYFHYQPSFYHLHVHFSAVTFDAPGTWVGKAHHIKEVIHNLENDGDHYKKAILPFTIKDNHPLREKFETYGYFSKETKEQTKSVTNDCHAV